MTDFRALRTIADTARYFSDLAEAQTANPDVERFIDGYLELRLTLSRAFQTLAHSGLDLEDAGLQEVREQVTSAIESRYGPSLPAELLQVRGYGGVRNALFSYLLMHEGRPVPGNRLRVLTMDQVHTERRVRELRDLGLEIRAERVGGDNQYTLNMTAFAPDVGARHQVRRNLKEAALAPGERVRLMDFIERRDAALDH